MPKLPAGGLPWDRLAVWLILAALFLSPLNGLPEYLYTFGMNVYPVADGHLVWLFKGLKDVLSLLIVTITIAAMRRNVTVRTDTVLLALLIYILAAFVLTCTHAPVLAFIGLRSLLPIAICLTGFIYLRECHLDSVARALTGITAVVVPLAMLQFFFGATMYDIDGRTFGRFASRIFSVFCMPGSFGVFLVAYIMFSSLHRGAWTKYLLPLAVITIPLTGSGMSLLALGLFATIVAFKRLESVRLKKAIIAALPFAIPLISLTAYYLLPVITHRPTIWRSPMARLALAADYFRSSGFLELLKGRGLGYGTNGSVNLLPHGSDLLRGAFIPESMYVSLISQIGIIGTILFVMMNVIAYRRAASKYRLMIPVFMFFGFTLPLLEVFPVNWLYMLLVGACLAGERLEARGDPAEERPANRGTGEFNVHRD